MMENNSDIVRPMQEKLKEYSAEQIITQLNSEFIGEKLELFIQ